MRKLLAFSLIALVACGGSGKVADSPAPDPTSAPSASASPETYDLHGTIDGVSCLVADSNRQTVQVFDEHGTLIAQGVTTRSTAAGCEVFQTFLIHGVPKAAFYTINIGERKGPTYSFAKMERLGFDVAIKYGF